MTDRVPTSQSSKLHSFAYSYIANEISRVLEPSGKTVVVTCILFFFFFSELNRKGHVRSLRNQGEKNYTIYLCRIYKITPLPVG